MQRYKLCRNDLSIDSFETGCFTEPSNFKRGALAKCAHRLSMYPPPTIFDLYL